MLRGRMFVVSFAVAAILGTAGTAAAYHTRFVADNCNYAAPTPTSYITRDGSAAVALRARYEGYQWAGGCWNDNDRDDSPNDPHEDSATGGEGGDCSGFTFKVWRESLNQSDAGFDQWGMLRNVHGPYTAAAFKAGTGAPNVTVSKVGPDQDGRLGERYAYRFDLRSEPRRHGPDHRGQGRGLWHWDLDPDVPRKFELQRRQEDRLELMT